MIGTSGEGWLMSLADDPVTGWGDVDSFYEDVHSFYENLLPTEGEENQIIVEDEVWGNLQSNDVQPIPGDGFAFYHSTRATFPEGDSYGRKPRISLIGELLDIQVDGRNVTWISVAVDPAVLIALQARPIVRDDSTRHLFEQCGIVKGAIATYYRADPPTWTKFVSLLEERLQAV